MMAAPSLARYGRLPPTGPLTAPSQTGIPGVSTLAAPVPTTPIQAPNLPPSPQTQPFGYQPPAVGQAPTPTPYGTFQPPTGPDPYQFRVDQANKGAQRSAAAHGTLLSGGFQAALARLNQNLAAEETQNIYNRALTTYGANRDTNAQNYGQQLQGYNAGTGAALDAGRLSLAGSTAAYDRNYGAQRDVHSDAVTAAGEEADVLNANASAADIYRRQMEEYRAQLDAQRQADTRRQNAETDRMRGSFPTLARMPGAARMRMHA